jgi:hypothetical protein
VVRFRHDARNTGRTLINIQSFSIF